MTTTRTFLGALIGLILFTLLFLVIERVFGRRAGKPLIRRGWLLDVSYFFLTPLVTKSITRLGLLLPLGVLVWFGVASVESLKTREFAGFGPVSRQPLWLQIIQIYALSDLIGYWTHRLFHRGRWWPFHAVHHSSEDLDWLSSVRVHPVNDLVSKLLQVTPLLLLGFNPFATLSAAPFFTLYAILLHADVNWDFGPLRGVIASPVFHRWHHSRQREAWDKNFAGLLPIWDRLFGTYHMPPGRVPEDFGIMEEMPRDLLGQLVRPFSGLRRASVPSRLLATPHLEHSERP
jgi:sterol desaturase/sphingolipid hydroxylase (fatty acid hydroxylase superfamily)